VIIDSLLNLSKSAGYRLGKQYTVQMENMEMNSASDNTKVVKIMGDFQEFLTAQNRLADSKPVRNFVVIVFFLFIWPNSNIETEFHGKHTH